MVLSSTVIHFPSSTPGNLSVPEKMQPTLNSTNSTMYENWYRSNGDSLPDLSSIRFKNDGSNESRNIIRENLIEKLVARGVLRFALQMDFALSSEVYMDTGDISNVVFSPLSIAAALAMVMLGSVGRTYTEIANVLGFAAGINLSASSNELHYHFGRFIKKIEDYPNTPRSTYVAIAGAIFVQDGFPVKERFANLSKETYASEVQNLDFSGHNIEARDVINK
jgi:serpin B